MTNYTLPEPIGTGYVVHLVVGESPSSQIIKRTVIHGSDVFNADQMQQAFKDGAASRDAEIEALRADALRYRWLRDHVIFGYPSSEGSSNKAAYLVVTGYGYRERKNLTDQAVDAASAAEATK